MLEPKSNQQNGFWILLASQCLLWSDGLSGIAIKKGFYGRSNVKSTEISLTLPMQEG